jgi:hypothetical protein
VLLLDLLGAAADLLTVWTPAKPGARRSSPLRGCAVFVVVLSVMAAVLGWFNEYAMLIVPIALFFAVLGALLFYAAGPARSR